MSLAKIVLSLVVSYFAVTRIYAAKILAYYPTPSISHHIVFRQLTNELVRRGHQVTVVTTDPEFIKGEAPTNLTEIDVHDISYQIIGQYVQQAVETPDIWSQMEGLLTTMMKIIEKQFHTPEVKKVLDKKNKYDLLIVEAFVRPPLVLSYIFDAPIIQFSSLGLILDNYRHFGIPQHDFLHPSYYHQKFYNLSISEKLRELHGLSKLTNFFCHFEKEENRMLESNFGKGVPTISVLANNIDMIFLNSHPLFEGVWPMPKNVVHIYGLHKKPTKDLLADLKRYLDSSKEGVIYISFGTNVQPSALPQEKIQILIKVVSELPYNVLWRWDMDFMVNKTKNIKLLKWVPQADLLKHPKIKLFIMQGGLQSIDEAIEACVPIIGVPFIVDQWFNVAQIVRHKIGLQLNMETLTEEHTRIAVRSVLEDPSFRQNMVRLKTLMDDQQETPLERAISWTEYVLRHNGAKHLRASGANMPVMEFYEVELAIIVILGLFMSIIAILFTVFYFCKIKLSK